MAKPIDETKLERVYQAAMQLIVENGYGELLFLPSPRWQVCLRDICIVIILGRKSW